ncbi:PD-(D/E)XK nuclease family protein [Peribacillus asahii]|uniref:PDDEXK-like family protein n=1 Tax=Peribacillus asahii TaxID=228899 RepID=UPI0038089387
MSYSFETIAQLDHSKEFAHLHKKFHQFNPLKVLRVDHFEIRHSNVLAWLLDPDENHQFGSLFIRKLLSRLITRSENEEKLTNLDYLPLLYSSLTDTLVYREVKTSTGRFIDLLVELPSIKVVLVIENKFHASESENQLKDYLDYARDQYRDYTIIPVYLTLASDAPSHPEYWALDYHDVLDIISQHLELNQEVIADNIHDFLTYYTAILHEELVEDDESIQMALEVYQMNQIAIDTLFVSQHHECRKQPRFKDLYLQIDNLTVSQQLALKHIYDKKKKTIDYIFTIGSNVLRQAFLSFAQIEEIPQEVYNAHVKVPNFILPEWQDFDEIIGKPEQGYWLGHGLIIWFERTWDDNLKINVEVGPVPYVKRIQLLNALEIQGVSFRSSAKLEGKKYTKIYTEATMISDWADKQNIVEGMERLYNDDQFNNLLRQIATAIESLVKKEEQQNEVESAEVSILDIDPKKRIIPKDAFVKFAMNHGISSGLYKIKNHDASFLVPIFRELENIYGVTRMKWWWHDSTFTYWYERLKDGRLKLTLELGPLVPEKRLSIVEQLEEMGVGFSVKSKLPSARYTRIFSKSLVIRNWEDVEEVYQAMENLFNDSINQSLLKLIESL